MTTVALMQVLKTKMRLELSLLPGEEYQVYLGEREVNTINMECGRDMNGTLHSGNTVKKRKITLIEV